MSKYIKESDVLKILNKQARDAFTLSDEYKFYLGALHDVAYGIKELPTEDVAPVVRCKGCKHYAIYELKSDGTDDRRYKQSVCVKDKYAVHRKPDWFCADGEKVTE